MRRKVLVGKLLVVALLLLTSCALLSRRVKIGEEFTLRPGEKVVVSGTDLGIQLKSVGHQWYLDRRVDSPYAELMVTGGGASSRSVTVSQTLAVGDYTIKVIAANPFKDNGGPIAG